MLTRCTQHKTLDIISLFHKPAAPSSLRVVTLLKQISAQASETATEDQASDHTHQNKLQRTTFELNVTEEVPTSDQLRTILEYVGEDKASEIVEGAKDSGDAIRRLKQNPKLFKAPVVSQKGLDLYQHCKELTDSRQSTGTMEGQVSK